MFEFDGRAFGFEAEVSFGWIGLIAAGDFVAVDPKSDFAVDSANVVEVPVGRRVAEVTFGETSGSVGREWREGFKF